MELRPGVRLDRYTLVSPLGEGGQATVWKALDPLEGDAVRALKVFHLAGSSAQIAERARREAKASARAQHPGLLPCRTLFEDPAEDIVALVFDYVRGRSLADALSDPRMTSEHRRCAVRQIADTLAYVHERDVIHRDVKPDNVLVTDAFWDAPDKPGTLKLVDFGIAAPAGNPNPLTRKGGIVGTAPYLPPELLDTQDLFGTGTDFQRDVFAFGVLAWEVLVGKHPADLPLDASRDAFAGVYLSARAGKRPWPPEGARSLDVQVVATCLALYPRDRPGSAAAISKALRACDGAVSPSRESGAPEQRTSNPVTVTHEAPSVGFASDRGRSSTEPMQVSVPRPPVDTRPPRTEPGEPASGAYRPVPAPAPATPSRRKPRRWLPILLGAVLLLAVAAAVFAFFTKQLFFEPPAPTTQPVAPAPSPNPTPSPSPTRTQQPTKPAPAPPPVICCPAGETACPSERECKNGCSSAHVNEQRLFRLRVRGGFALNPNKVEIQLKWPDSQICMKNTRTGEESCASSKTILRKYSDPVNRILATPEDLQKGRISVSLIGTALHRGAERAFGYPLGYSTKDLCDGITVNLGDYDNPTGKIYLYLDEP